VLQDHDRAVIVCLTMLSLADRWVKALSDVTVGTVIVLVHVAMADRTNQRLHPVQSRTSRVAN
jgi:hypothetical protein